MSSTEETQNIIIKIDKVKNKSTPKKQLEERINQQEEQINQQEKRIKYLENIIQNILTKEKEEEKKRKKEEEEKRKKEKQDYELLLKEYKIWYTELATETGGINPLILTSRVEYIEIEIVRLLLIKYKSIGGNHPEILKFKNPISILREIKKLEGLNKILGK